MAVKIKSIKKNYFVHIAMQFGDVWHQVAEVYDNACSIFVEKESVRSSQVSFSSDQFDVKTDYKRVKNITNVRKILPKNARCVYCKEGAFSERRNNLKDIPSKYFGKK